MYTCHSITEQANKVSVFDHKSDYNALDMVPTCTVTDERATCGFVVIVRAFGIGAFMKMKGSLGNCYYTDTMN